MSQPIDFLLTRRSVKAANLVEPAPKGLQLELILQAATRVPDHGKLAPWRIKVLHKDGQKKLGELFAKRFVELNPDANEKQIEHERQRPQRAPLLLVVTLNPVESIKAPLWEQELSVGAVCMNILHAAHMLGFSANWITEWPAFDAEITVAISSPSTHRGEARRGALFAESSHDGPHPNPPPVGKGTGRIAGFIFIGTAKEKPDERERPQLEDVVEEWH